MTCDKCGKEYKENELETIRSKHKARFVYGLDDNRLGYYYICIRCKSET
jgi:hypothetical protein